MGTNIKAGVVNAHRHAHWRILSCSRWTSILAWGCPTARGRESEEWGEKDMLHHLVKVSIEIKKQAIILNIRIFFWDLNGRTCSMEKQTLPLATSLNYWEYWIWHDFSRISQWGHWLMMKTMPRWSKQTCCFALSPAHYVERDFLEVSFHFLGGSLRMQRNCLGN